MQGNESQCFNSEVSGIWTLSDVSHKKTFTLNASVDKKKAAKGKRKANSEAKAAALLLQCAALRANPGNAANPAAARQAAAAVLFDFGAAEVESSASPTVADRAFATIYSQLDSNQNTSEFQLNYENNEDDDKDEEEEEEEEGEEGEEEAQGAL
jgi:hypothetical protein